MPPDQPPRSRTPTSASPPQPPFITRNQTLSMFSKLIQVLSQQLGSQQALQEFKWMKLAVSPTTPSLARMLQRRILGEPLQYIIGCQPFGSLDLLTRPPVLIPRPETEHWVIKLAERLSSTPVEHPRSLLDLGTGSGCIPLLLCSLCPAGTIHAHGVDISEHAIQLATDNAALSSIPTPSHTEIQRNTFKITQANFLSPTFSLDAKLELPFDLITSNPPYIPWKEYLELPRSVTDYEDPKALFGGPTGLDFYHAIARLVGSKGFLRPSAVVALEVGHEQASDVQHIMNRSRHWSHIEIWRDPWGKQRTVVASL